MGFRKKAEAKQPPVIHPEYDTPRKPTPQRPKRFTGVGYHGSDRVRYEVDEVGQKVIIEPQRLAGQVVR